MEGMCGWGDMGGEAGSGVGGGGDARADGQLDLQNSNCAISKSDFVISL